MRKRKIYDDKLQIDYFSDSYLKFEEDFYRYSAMDIPYRVFSRKFSQAKKSFM